MLCAYDATDPCQLKTVTHIQTSSFGVTTMPVVTTLIYDEAGCLVNDGEGRIFTYDIGINCGALLSVTKAGQTSNLAHDPWAASSMKMEPNCSIGAPRSSIKSRMPTTCVSLPGRAAILLRCARAAMQVFGFQVLMPADPSSALTAAIRPTPDLWSAWGAID